jgi:hypothetical protein
MSKRKRYNRKVVQKMDTKKRIEELNAEREKGLRMMAELQGQLQNTQAAILRIEGGLALLAEIEQETAAVPAEKTDEPKAASGAPASGAEDR